VKKNTTDRYFRYLKKNCFKPNLAPQNDGYLTAKRKENPPSSFSVHTYCFDVPGVGQVLQKKTVYRRRLSFMEDTRTQAR
jgi:hypothetical protein